MSKIEERLREYIGDQSLDNLMPAVRKNIFSFIKEVAENAWESGYEYREAIIGLRPKEECKEPDKIQYLDILFK